MLAGLLFMFASCSDGGSDSPETPKPQPQPEANASITFDSDITSSGLVFDEQGGEKSVSFTTNKDWTLSIAATTRGTSWCTASEESGSKGDVTIKFTVTENTEIEDRSVAVTIKAGTASQTFKIAQKGVDALLVTTSTFEVPQEGGTIDVEVKANIDYQLEIAETAKGWITEATSRALTAKKHSFAIAVNEENEKREGEIYIKSGDKLETVKVYQAGGALILLSQNEYTVSDAGETITVDVKSNVEYGVQMPDVDWIVDEASARGMSSHTLQYTILPNETYDSRSAEIIFYDKNSDLKETLTITQVQMDAIILSQKEINVAKEGETIEVKVNTNVDFEVQIPSDATWITQTDSRALTEKSIYLKIAENTGDDAREAEILFINKESQISESYIINQSGAVKAGYADGVVTIAKAGTMKSLLGDDYLNITSLKIVGPINGDDVYYLRKMLGGSDFSEADWGKLTTLDLSEATIVEGGEWYCENFYSERYYTSNNEIGDYMFYRCNNLQNISLPDNVTSIGNYAFRYCKALTEITIPDNITSIGDDAFIKCQALAKVTIKDLSSWCKIEFYNGVSNPLSYGSKLYLNDKEITQLVIPEDISAVKDSVFYGCTSITSVTIHDNVTSIGDYAFKNCEVLTSVTIGNSVTSIGDGAFSSCNVLTSVTIGNSVTSIGDDAFSYCSALTEITIPDGVISIGGAFSYCSALTEITIPDGVISIGGGAFLNCEALTEVTIGNAVTSIGGSAFCGCSINVLYCYATTPPKLGYYYSSFDNEVRARATLYVPARCGSAYKSSQWGNYFINIVEME